MIPSAQHAARTNTQRQPSANPSHSSVPALRRPNLCAGQAAGPALHHALRAHRPGGAAPGAGRTKPPLLPLARQRRLRARARGGAHGQRRRARRALRAVLKGQRVKGRGWHSRRDSAPLLHATVRQLLPLPRRARALHGGPGPAAAVGLLLPRPPAEPPCPTGPCIPTFRCSTCASRRWTSAAPRAAATASSRWTGLRPRRCSSACAISCASRPRTGPRSGSGGTCSVCVWRAVFRDGGLGGRLLGGAVQ